MALGAKSPSPARFNWRVVGSTESLKNSNRISKGSVHVGIVKGNLRDNSQGWQCSAVYVCLVNGGDWLSNGSVLFSTSVNRDFFEPTLLLLIVLASFG